MSFDMYHAFVDILCSGEYDNIHRKGVSIFKEHAYEH